MYIKLSLAALFIFAAAAATAGNEAIIRINQIGYLAAGPKQAFLMAGGPETGATFKVLGAGGAAEFSGQVTGSGTWSKTYPNVYTLDFSAVKKAGKYVIKVEGPYPAESPAFAIGTGAELYTPLLRNTLYFFQAQRDGVEVDSAVLHRKPAHLTDKAATVYKAPNYGGSSIRGALQKIGGPVDVSGGWFDAGDFIKFVQTASYATGVMLTGARPSRGWPASRQPALMSGSGRSQRAI